MLSEELNGRALTDREIKDLLKVFFRGREDSQGRPLKRRVVCTAENIETVRSVELLVGLEILKDAAIEYRYSGDPVALFLSLQRRCYDAGVPKEYSGGITVVYLQLCMGWRF